MGTLIKEMDALLEKIQEVVSNNPNIEIVTPRDYIGPRGNAFFPPKFGMDAITLFSEPILFIRHRDTENGQI